MHCALQQRNGERDLMAVISQVPKTWTQNPWQPGLKPVLPRRLRGAVPGQSYLAAVRRLVCRPMGPGQPTTKARRAPSGGSDSVLCTWPAWPRLGRAPWLDQPVKGMISFSFRLCHVQRPTACPALSLCRARCRQGASCGAPDLAGTLLHLLQSSSAPQPRARSTRPEGGLPGAARAGGTGEGRGRNEPDRWAGCQVLGAKWSGRLASPPVCRVSPVRHLHDLPAAPEDLGDLARMKTAAGINGLEYLACSTPCSRDEGVGSIIDRSGRRVSGKWARGGCVTVREWCGRTRSNQVGGPAAVDLPGDPVQTAGTSWWHLVYMLDKYQEMPHSPLAKPILPGCRGRFCAADQTGAGTKAPI